MGKYFVNDYIETKHGLAIIKKVWQLTDIVTVFEIRVIKGNVKKEIFYGDIIKLMYRG